MSLNVTIAVPRSWLGRLIADYPVLERNDDKLRAAVKAVLTRALEMNVRPDACPPLPADAEKRRLMVSFPDVYGGMLRDRAARAGLGPGPTAVALLGAMLDVAPAPEQCDESDPIVSLTRALQAHDPLVTLRAEQVQVAAMLRDCLHRGMIGVVEAGTGVGKTRAMVASALDWIETNEKSACIAVPTLAVARQFAGEYAVQAGVRSNAAPLRAIFGRREFVSEFALLRFLDDAQVRAGQHPDIDAVRDWIRAGAPSPLSDEGVDSCWLVASLESVAPGFPIDEVRLSDIWLPGDRGYRAYRAQFDVGAIRAAHLIVCTHAMLAQDMRFRLREAYKDEAFRNLDRELIATLKRVKEAEAASEKEDARGAIHPILDARAQRFEEVSEDGGLLPDYWALIVDEAHQLEQNFASALSDYVSLKATVRAAWSYRQEGGQIKLQTINALEALVAEMTALGHACSSEFISLSGLNAADDAPLGSGPALAGVDPRKTIRSVGVLLQRMAALLAEVPKPRKDVHANLARAVAGYRLRGAAAAFRAAAGEGAVRSYLRFSPIRSYPQLYMGSRSVETTLRTMWSRVEAGAVVSATLYLTRADDKPDAQYQRMLLGLPDKRWVEYPPVHATWSLAPIMGLWTAGSKARALRPPTRADRLTNLEHLQAEDRWMDALAPEIRSIHATAHGGVLVLMTSYRTVAGVADRLSDLGQLTVVATEGFALKRQVDTFLGMRKAGMRPLWLAVGSAWTGIDVGGHEPWSRHFGGDKIVPEVDNVLTDLVIPRLPYGTNQSITHLWRTQNRTNVPWDLLEAAFKLKQGLGRLVRRAGLPANRRIFVLDGRLGDKGAASAHALFIQLIEPYRPRDLTSDPIAAE